MKKAQLRTSAERRLLRENLVSIVGGTVALAIFFTALLLIGYKTTQQVVTSDYEGRIVDRWGEYTESEQGSRPYFRLVVEGQDSKRFTVKVDANIYESAKSECE